MICVCKSLTEAESPVARFGRAYCLRGLCDSPKKEGYTYDRKVYIVFQFLEP